MGRGFRSMDSNGDGIIEVMIPENTRRARAAPVSNGQPITLQEYQANLRRQFHKLDRNRDGYLNARELTAPPR